MGDPPEDPGGTTVPPAASFVDIISTNVSELDRKTPTTPIDILISAIESSMDTDCSASDSNKLKRKRLTRVMCNTCHKRKRRQGSKIEKPSDCNCQLKPQQELNTDTVSPQTVELESHFKNHEKVPHLPIGRSIYQASDAAPYVVHVQKEILSSNDGVTLHPVTFGRFLKKNDIKGIVNGSIKRIGRNRVSLGFTNYTEANSFLSNTHLQTENYKVFIPTFNITRMGVVRGVPLDWSDEEVKSNITVPIGCGPVIKIRRLKKKVIINNSKQFENTGTIVVTFDGQVLPTRVYMCYTALPVSLYIYPTVQCFNCCRYGHMKSQCRSTPRCFKCGQGHSGDTCNVEEEFYHCCLCNGSHQATSKKCLEFDRQKAVKETMSKSCVSYVEAVKQHPPISKISYADALINSTSPSSSPTRVGNNPVFNTPTHISQSYKKTVFLKPKPLPKFSKGYDHLAHSEIVRQPALSSKPILLNHDCPNSSDITNINISEIIKQLIQMLSQSNIVSPANVAAVIDALYQIYNTINNGSQSQSNSVELS